MLNTDWLKCYQYIGSYIVRVLIRDDQSHFYCGVPFAPTFWMLAKGDRPTLGDFAREDARLAKRLQKLSADETYFEDEFWTWINSADEEHPLIDGGMDEPILQSNLEEFKEALLQKLIEESSVQMSHIKKGICTTLGDAAYLLDFINWHDMMDIVQSTNEEPSKGLSTLKLYHNI